VSKASSLMIVEVEAMYVSSTISFAALFLFKYYFLPTSSESSRASHLEEAKHREEEIDRASLSPYPHKHHHDDENDPKPKDNNPDEEYERAQQAILHAVTTVENHAQRLIAAEVDTFFHGMEDQKEKKKVAKKAKRAVAEGSRKVKETVTSSSDQKESNVYPFENSPYTYFQHSPTNKPSSQHKDHRILKAIEAAEHAVLHAIEAEVDTLFHADDDDHEQQHKATVQSGLQKASKKVQDQHKDRRDWLAKFAEKEIEAYTQQTVFGLQ